MRKFSAKMLFALTICALLLVNNSAGESTNITDVRTCRVTHAGTEYSGHLSKTVSGIRCQFWETKYPIHEVSENIVDEQFPDGKKSLARNYCRNPGSLRDEPWCYTMDKKVTDDYCDVPLCRYNGCRLTGPGVEYAGKVHRAASERDCLSWNSRHREKGTKEATRFPHSVFPEGSRRKAGHRCRNPDGDPGGPWCYVRREFEEEGDKENEEEEDEQANVERDYCSIPFCNEQDCVLYTTGGEGQVVHSHWTPLQKGNASISFAMKLWNPEEWNRVSLHLALSVLSIPSSGSQLQEWQTGVELVLSNTNSGIVAGGKSPALVSTPGLVWGTRWTKMWVRVEGGNISMGKQEDTTPLISGEYNNTGLFRLNSKTSLYYSIVGESGMWSFPSCISDCEVQTTTRLEFVRFWQLMKTTTTREAMFFVRAVHSASLELRVSPTIKYPRIRLMMGGRKNKTELILQRSANSSQIVMRTVRVDTLLSYWDWREFSISLFGDTLSVFWTRTVGTQTLIEARHEVIRSMQWISPGSRSTAHWTLLCAPTEAAKVPAAFPPQCSTSEADTKYMGSQWITMTGQPCLPWVYAARIMSFLRNDEMFEDGSAVAALNYCRNPTKDPQGPFCFIQDEATNLIQTEYCHPRKCRASECHMAGTGNDYMGELNVTRSKRICQRWTVNTPHVVDKTYRNDTLYPERSVEKARNYCRNPSRNIAGSWCYTLDPKVPQDVCDVRDCEKPEECTVLTRGVGEGRLVYIRNKWRKEGLKFWLKEWDPDLPDGIIFVIRPLSGDNYYKLIIGAEDNEKVLLFYGAGGGKKEVLLKEKTLPHLIPIGKWGGFWLRIPTGSISLGYEGLENHLFDWEHGSESLTKAQRHEIFKPMFITYTSVKGNTIGVNFPCDECHTEKTTTNHITKMFPLGLWSKEPGGNYNSLTLHMRGTGLATIPLTKLPGLGNYYGLIIGKSGNRLYYVKNDEKGLRSLKRVDIAGPMIHKDEWTVFHIRYNETDVSVDRNGNRLLEFKHNLPMLYYWFSLGADEGEVTWSANCDPEDIDGDPRNGGWSEWSPWTCTVTCGGGEGIQTRTCTNPTPNVYGEDCTGVDKLEGVCNNFKCGEISPDTSEYLRYLLRKSHQSSQVLEGQQVELICDQEALGRIQTEAPTSLIKWALNGVDVNLKETRSFVRDNNNLVIRHADPSDAGVYTCISLQEPQSQTIISVATLAVKPKTPTIKTRETRSIQLYCQSELLSYIYRDLTQRWEVNGTLRKEYGFTTLSAVNTEEIRHVKLSDAGEWKCVVRQPELNFEWVTNWIIVEVNHAPNFLTYLMEDAMTAPVFRHFGSEAYVLTFLIGFLLLTIAVVAALTFVHLRWCRLR